MDALESILPSNTCPQDPSSCPGSPSDPVASIGVASGSLLDNSSGSTENDDIDDSERTRCHLEALTDACDISSQECSIEEMDEKELLKMIENGDVGYEIEEILESEPMETEDEPIEFMVESIRPSLTDTEILASPPDASRKRCAEDEIPTDSTAPQDKKPKYTDGESEASVLLETAPLSPSRELSCTTLEAVPKIEAITEPNLSTEPVMSCVKKSPPNKTPARVRGSSVLINTPLSVVTRRGALSAATSGAEMIVPEHSHSVPRFMPRVPVRAIEIPIWSVRDTYEEEEELIAQYQQLKRSLPRAGNGHKSESSSSLRSLESQYFSLADRPMSTSNVSSSFLLESATTSPPTTTNGAGHRSHSFRPVRTSNREEDDKDVVGDDDYYAVRHYRFEIAERLRWESGPGSDRFKKEERDMTIDQFRRHPLAATYVNSTTGRLLPEEKWVQNMVHERPKSTRKDRSAGRSPSTKSSPKTSPPPPTLLSDEAPKKFIFKIKTATSTKIIATSFPIPPSVPLKPSSTSSKKSPYRLQPPPPIVKKSGLPPNSPYMTTPNQQRLPPSLSLQPVSITPPIAPNPPPPKPPMKLIVKLGSKTFGTKPTTTAEPTADASSPAATSLVPLTTLVPTSSTLPANVSTGPNGVSSQVVPATI